MKTSFFKNMKNTFKHLDSKTMHLIDINNFVSSLFELTGIILMYIHYKYYISKFLFSASLNLFITGVLIAGCGYIFGIAINQYKETHT
jgi:hypothetical protein